MTDTILHDHRKSPSRQYSSVLFITRRLIDEIPIFFAINQLINSCCRGKELFTFLCNNCITQVGYLSL